ncbi:ABC transporter substrate-binding protein [Alteromonas sp. a30]|uniref:ABC transporter substrate-binding protein n=1 Tax=Alteromonas sp. a30 TaxID=2730917 RepID=UPI002280D2E3|nr:ABC transporter substrate-binding protein [Alteromonas sp. a30]MCY7297085.1 ABC transporter substrate-binding protein [Alteromonas sp. a30]
MTQAFRIMILAVMLVTLLGCSPSNKLERIVIATTPWLGYYPLYYADEIQLDEQLGIDLEIIENLSTNDFRRSIVKSYIDGFASSIQGVSQINQILTTPLDLVLFTNFSSGGDVIIARKSITALSELEGKRVGFRRNEISHFVALNALKLEDLTEDDIHHIEANPLDAVEMFERREIDAFVTYPPISISLLKDPDLHVIFTSKSLPIPVLDCIVFKGDRSESKQQKLIQLWDAAIKKIRSQPNAYLQFLSSQLGTTMPEAKKNLEGITLLTLDEQKGLFSSPEQIKEILLRACEVSGTKASLCIRDLHFIRFGGLQL